MAVSEQAMVDATLLAIDELNAKGGVLGRSLEAVVLDGQSSDAQFAIHAKRLLSEHKVDVLFACWTSSCRKTLKPLVEAHNALMFYSVQYEGMEQSENIIYSGSTLNQQVLPAVKWSIDHLGKKVFLVASDYVFPHAANKLIKPQLLTLGASIVGEAYLPLGSQDVQRVVSDIKKTKPELILNTVNGNTNESLFEAFHHHNIFTPVMSFSVSETEMSHFLFEPVSHHYAARSYFQSIESRENRAFISRFKQRYGEQKNINASMVSAYSSVLLWAKAVEKVKTVDADTVRHRLNGFSVNGPGGRLTVSYINNHSWKPLHIGQLQADKQFKILWSSDGLIRPLPYPSYESIQYWHDFLNGLHDQWGQKWVAPTMKVAP